MPMETETPSKWKPPVYLNGGLLSVADTRRGFGLLGLDPLDSGC